MLSIIQFQQRLAEELDRCKLALATSSHSINSSTRNQLTPEPRLSMSTVRERRCDRELVFTEIEEIRNVICLKYQLQFIQL